MRSLFCGDGAEPLDNATREQALAWLLQMHPEDPVAAFTVFGSYTAMPDSMPIGDRPLLEGRSGIESAEDAESRQQMVAAWDLLLRRGANHFLLRRTGESDVTCLWLDLRERHGVILGLFTGLSAAERDELRQSSRYVIEQKPRLASLRKDVRATIIDVDECFTAILGWTTEDLHGKRSLDLLQDSDHPLAIENWIELMSGNGRGRSLRQRMRAKNGEWRWFEVTNINQLADPEHNCVLCELVDISEQMAAEEQLRAREQLLHRLTAALPVGVLQLDREQRILFANDRLWEILGVEAAESLSAQLETVDPADRARLQKAIESCLDEGLNSDLDIRVVQSGESFRRQCSIAMRALSHEDGSISGAVLSIDDVTEQARLQAELRRRATFDELTGCFNRASVMSALEGTLAISGDRDERAVMFVDLDGFKEVNDCYGHATGDELLRRVAAHLRSLIRTTDTVGRFGGDEFLIVCPGIGGAQAAMALAERLSGTLIVDGIAERRIECQISVGVDWSCGSFIDADLVVARADRAMYESKRQHSGRPQLAPVGT